LILHGSRISSEKVINNNVIQINTFNYQGCTVSYEGENDTEDKISKFLKVTGLINTISKSLEVQKH
jgi:hypothetical protein